MRRSLLSLQSVICSFRKPEASRHGCQSIAAKLEALRNFATLTSHAYLGRERKPLTKSIQVQIVNALCLGERSRASTMLLDLSSESNSVSANDFVYILNYCARAPDPLFVMETWRIMLQKEIHMNGESYFLIVQTLCKGGYLKEALKVISAAGENPDIYPVLPMYNNYLEACAEMHNINYANECLDLMEHQMVGKNEVTYTTLLKIAVLQKSLSAVHEIWKEFIKYYSLSIISLRNFIWSFTKLRDLKSAYVALQHMVILAVRGDSFIEKNAEGKLHISRLDVPIPSNNHLSLKRLIEENESFISSLSKNSKKLGTRAIHKHCATFGMEMKEVGSAGIIIPKKHLSFSVTKILRWSFNAVISECGHKQNCLLAEQLILQMQNLGLELSAGTYVGFIRAAASRGFQDGMEVFKLMKKKNVKPCDSTLATLSISCSKGLELDLAEAFLDQISTSRTAYPFNSFLEACDTLDQPERAVRLLAKMKKSKIKPDIRTYELLFSLFSNVNAPFEKGNMLSQVDAAKRINAIEMDMVKNGLQHSQLSMINILNALGSEGMIRELIQYLRAAENQSSRNNTYLRTPIYNTVLHWLFEAKESRMASEIFKAMKSCAYPRDAETYNIMIEFCTIIGCFKSACALVSMMIRDGFSPQPITYTSLIKILLRYEDFDEAFKLLNKGCLEGIQPDVILYNTILRAACEKGMIDVIEHIVKRMHQDKIQPNPSTCSYVFSAYVERGFLNTAMEALQVLSMQMISQDSNILEEKRLEFEELILSENAEVESQILEHFRHYKDNVAVALFNLRWCAIVGLPISWLPDQSQWTMRILTS